jgi:uncharacterized membrane protein YjjB (DUF3815 family)
MTTQELIQVLSGFIGSLCFGILFNMRGKRLIAASFGGLLSWGLFVTISYVIPSEPINYFLVAAIMSFYSEILARIIKTPAAPIVTTALIPLIPGGSLYYTMASAFDSDFSVFLEKATYTLKLASALALGIIVVTAVFHLYSTMQNKRNV